MSRALRSWQIGRTCIALLRSAADSPLHVPILNHAPPAPVPERLWLPPWPAPAADRGGVSGCSQRSFASGTEDGSGHGEPPSSTQPAGDTGAAPAEQPQPSQPHSTSGHSSPDRGPTPGPKPDSASEENSPGSHGRRAASSLRPPDGASSPRDASREDMVSVVVPSDRLEHEADALLDAWEPLMAQEEMDVDAILSVLAEHLGDVPGLPSPQEILEAGDVEEQKEKELRRQREEALKQQFAASRVRVVDHLGRSYATGKRKCSVARVWVMEGSGRITVNRRRMTDYFPAMARRLDVLRPFEVTNTLGAFNVMSTVRGGGSTGQAQALRHGIARALQLFQPALRPALKAEGLLTRDSRVVERKKPGLAKARKAFQWVKR